MDNDQRWTSDTTRNDGLKIVQGMDGYVILPGDDSSALDRCPCCDIPFKSITSARMCADMIYHMRKL